MHKQWCPLCLDASKYMRLSIICWGHQNSYFTYLIPMNPQFTDLSPLSAQRHPKCSCPKQNLLFPRKTHSVLSLPTSISDIPSYLVAQYRNTEFSTLMSLPRGQCQFCPFHLQNCSPIYSLLSTPTVTTFIQVFSDYPWTLWCPCSTSSLSNQSCMVPPM